MSDEQARIVFSAFVSWLGLVLAVVVVVLIVLELIDWMRERG